MTFLLDTHAFLWFCQDAPSLSARAKALIEDPANRKVVSLVSCWEIAIKAGLGKLILGELNEWRNAIAHQDFTLPGLGGRTTLHLADVRDWRRAINRLAQAFDEVMRAHLQTLPGVSSW